MTDSLNHVFGRQLRAHRADAGLSQEAFAERLGMHRTYIGALERGERNISLNSLENMARLLGVDPRDLLHEPDGQVKKRGRKK